MIVEDLYGWAPALMNGFYAVAPLSRDDCIGIPDEDIAFIGNELEWTIGSFRADPAAIDGLMNVHVDLAQDRPGSRISRRVTFECRIGTDALSRQLCALAERVHHVF